MPNHSALPDSPRRGLILINTGPGKGKTTAAMGTALRAVGNGMRVLMLQFLKGSWHYGELDSTKAFGDNFVLRQMGRGFVKVGGAETDPEDIRLVAGRMGRSAEAILSGEWDMVVLDEINYAIGYGMLDPRSRRNTPQSPRDGPRHSHRAQRAPFARRARRYRHRDARSQARLSERHPRPARHRVLAGRSIGSSRARRVPHL